MIETYNEGGLGMDEFDIAVLDMSAFEFKLECHEAYKHEGAGYPMHRGPSDATHIIASTCGTCKTETEEQYVCLNFIEEAYGDKILKWRCGSCLNLNRYPASIKIIGVI